MARDFENIDDIEDLSDDELRELVLSQLAAHNGIDPDDITVTVEDGVVQLAGRVGTEGEVRIAEHILTDVLGLDRFENELVVDELRRAVSPEEVDEHLADEDAHAGLLLGDRPVPLNPEAEHRSNEFNDMKRAFGTSDVQDAIAEAAPLILPERPTQEGIEGTRAGGSGGAH
ncbi:MAG TPA: BON domain-containing protein [Gemmatimonadaceae bacterium]|nr:BON domain-containing protein [Gemmatimonadaceae bacterium]